jgi:hypothetical protein
LARWQELLSQYHFSKILHIKGRDNVVADALSRRPDFAPILDLFSLPLANLSTLISDTLTELVSAQQSDPFCSRLIRDLQTSRDPVLESRFGLTTTGALVWTA